MSNYIPNPKTEGSGILCCIPQTERCPNECEDCFFQSGRSYLEPLEENLPNIPPVAESLGRVVRVNDGNDSNVQRELVIKSTNDYSMKFYNTSIPDSLSSFDAPVVLTVNPAEMTDEDFYRVSPVPDNLMFVRFRINTWNLELCDDVVEYYSDWERPIVLTFMAYYDTPIPEGYRDDYVFRKRTLNKYWAITTSAWENVMRRYKENQWVYSCGKIEGENGTTKCRHCGNCLREFFATRERLRKSLGVLSQHHKLFWLPEHDDCRFTVPIAPGLVGWTLSSEKEKKL